jgi:hypothetical protein
MRRVLLITTAAFVVAVTPAEARSCGDVSYNAFGVKAENVRCSAARSLARRWPRASGCKVRWSGASESEYGVVRCTRSRKVVRFEVNA